MTAVKSDSIDGGFVCSWMSLSRNSKLVNASEGSILLTGQCLAYVIAGGE